MKTNKKLKLQEIPVNSFITNNEKIGQQGGGSMPNNISQLIIDSGINISQMAITELANCGTLSIIYDTTQIAIETGNITRSIIESGLNMNCAGATRAIANCTRGGDLC